MWNKIMNPKTGIKVNINSKIGKNILKKYIKQLGGSASSIECHTGIYKKLYDILNNTETKKIYLNMHGDNFLFKNNLKSRPEFKDYLIAKDMSKLTFKMPHNLILIHFYQVGYCGYADPLIDREIRMVLGSNRGWMNTDKLSTTIIKSRNSEKHYSLNNTAHLYLPGNEVYNSLLTFDDKDNTFDIYEIYKDHIFKIYDPISFGNKISNIKHKDKSSYEYISMEKMLTTLSKETPKDQYRLVYLYNCDPRLNNNYLDTLEFVKIQEKKHELDIKGLNRWVKFKNKCIKVPRTRKQFMGIKTMNEGNNYIDELDDTGEISIQLQKQAGIMTRGKIIKEKSNKIRNYGIKMARKNILNKQKYGVVTSSQEPCTTLCKYHGMREYVKGILQHCFGNKCKFATKTCKNINGKYEKCTK